MANPIGTWTLFSRENKRFLKVYKQTVFAPVISNLLFLAIFGLSVQRTIPGYEEVPYLAFLVPGLIMMGIINNAFQSPSSSIMIMKYQGLIQDILTIPLNTCEKLIGFIGSGVLRGLLVGAVTYITAIFFVDLSYASIPIILITSILVSIIFSFFGFLIGVWAKEFDKQALVMNFILMPLIFLGGVFYPVTALPDLFQKISLYNPIVYMINLLRYGFTGIEEFSVVFSLSVTAALTALLAIVSYFVLKSGWKLQT